MVGHETHEGSTLWLDVAVEAARPAWTEQRCR